MLVFFLVCCLAAAGQTYRYGLDPFRRTAFLDANNRYQVDWAINGATKTINFNVTVKTLGWILLGLRDNKDDTTKEDVIIGGVDRNGDPYFWEGHRDSGSVFGKRDVSQDYTLEGYWETRGYTRLSFSRSWDTCDDDDHPISDNSINLFWAFGTSDKENMEGETVVHKNDLRGDNRGNYDVYLLDPEYSPRVIPPTFSGQSPRIGGHDNNVWSVRSSTKLPSTGTTYLCSIHKGPRLRRKHHVTGFSVSFEDDISRNHTHHLLIYRCTVPRGGDTSTLFDKYVRSGEQQICYSPGVAVYGRNMPTPLCTQMLIAWAVGGREYFNPDDVGFPFGESLDEYYMMQVHYDNPQRRSDITASLQTNVFYSRQVREKDGGIIMIGQDSPGMPASILIPPNTQEERLFGHCSAECTRRMLPPEGISIVAVQLHSHNSGVKMKLRHFRGKRELPWIIYDDNFNNLFQQLRVLRQGPVKVLPSDMLTVECTYDNTWAEGSVLGGFSTRQEMCTAIIVHHSPISDYNFCGSDIISTEATRRFFGVTNTTWMETRLDWVATPPSPRPLVGRTLTDISNDVDWTPELRQELQQFHLGQAHTGKCSRQVPARDPVTAWEKLQPKTKIPFLVISGDQPTFQDTGDVYAGPVKYPFDAVLYQRPERECSPKIGYFGWRE